MMKPAAGHTLCWGCSAGWSYSLVWHLLDACCTSVSFDRIDLFIGAEV
jgi:hypothetical protein